MNKIIEKTWTGFIGPILQRPKRLQVAALCHKGEGRDRRYLLITSRGTKRWIIPKGWPITGLNSPQAALQEAWEEAGVTGQADSKQPVGTYSFLKMEETGWGFPVEALVYSVSVDETAKSFPEVEERTRTWVTAEEAAGMVAESGLSKIFLTHGEA